MYQDIWPRLILVPELRMHPYLHVGFYIGIPATALEYTYTDTIYEPLERSAKLSQVVYMYDFESALVTRKY